MNKLNYGEHGNSHIERPSDYESHEFESWEKLQPETQKTPPTLNNAGGPDHKSQEYIGFIKTKIKVKDVIKAFSGNSALKDFFEADDFNANFWNTISGHDASSVADFMIGIATKMCPQVGIPAFIIKTIGGNELDRLADICEFLKGEEEEGHDIAMLVTDYAWLPKGATGADVQAKMRYEKYHEYEADEKSTCEVTASAIKFRKKPYIGDNEANPAYGQLNKGTVIDCDKIVYTTDYKWVSFMQDGERYYMPFEQRSDNDLWVKRENK